MRYVLLGTIGALSLTMHFAVAQNAAERTHFKAVVASLSSHSCALTTDGAAYCWGSNGAGQLGTTALADVCKIRDAKVACSLVPVQVGANQYTAITLGAWHTCALTREGEAQCWGADEVGQVGSESANAGCPTPKTSEPMCQLGPVAVAGGMRFSTIAAGGLHTCGLNADGRAYCWGANDQGQLGSRAEETCLLNLNGQASQIPCSTRPAQVATETRFTAITAGWAHTCALSVDSLAYCWGSNRAGEAGAGQGERIIASPRLVSDTLKALAVSAGGAKTCAIATNGTPYCWGTFMLGDLSVGGTTPQPVHGEAPPFTALSVGGEHVCAIARDGGVYCWGDGREGQLGVGGFGLGNVVRVGKQASFAPARVSGSQTYATVSAGGTHTCAVAVDSTLYCWGADPFGALGNGSTQRKSKPELVRAPDRPGATTKE